MCMQDQTPIISSLSNYIGDGTIRFHMPGHKGRARVHEKLIQLLGEKVFQADVTNVPGMDDLHQTHSVIKQAQHLAAAAFGADRTYFLINGSSCGLQALVMTACCPGDKILVPRNMHRSILSGIILSGAVPVFFKPEYIEEFDIPGGVIPKNIARCLKFHPDVKAVMVINPTYHGITSEVGKIAGIVHRQGVPLLIDEAHGPHLKFHEQLPPSVLEQDADASVQGTHKILQAFTQASMLHVKGERLDRRRLEATLRILQSTSTSYLLMASLDGSRALMEENGRSIIQDALDKSAYLREMLRTVEGLTTFDGEYLQQRGGFGLDLTKVTISVKGLGITGLWAERWLRDNYQIQVEMADLFNLLLIVSANNTYEEIDKFVEALRSMKNYLGQHPQAKGHCLAANQVKRMPGIPELAITPREAFFSPVQPVPLAKSVGCISTEVIACYPPGIPVICPGERITPEIVDYLQLMKELGMHLQGCHDASLGTISVVK